jgi:hypothetical protein
MLREISSSGFPSRAKPSASALPMPELAPVIMTRFCGIAFLPIGGRPAPPA